MAYESDIQRAYKKARTANGCVVLKLDPDGVSIPKGFPDLLVITPLGTVEFVEMKTPIGRLSPAQQHWRDTLAAMGHTHIVAQSEG